MDSNRIADTHDIIIKFPTQVAAECFAAWLCNCGEQSYWTYMDVQEEDEKSDITAVQFNYHGEEDETKEKTDPKRYGKFMADNIIRTIMGRLHEDENIK